MSQADDEILLSFIEESREHLADIENDLLAIEEGGKDVDEDLVNKVFRAAHSVKGGAGFMGLDVIKDLSHKIENVLGMIRGGEILPASEVINILLLAFDRLREMINNSEESNDQDVSEHTVALDGITAAYLPAEDKSAVSEMVDIALPNGQTVFTLPRFDISQGVGDNEQVYLNEYDLIHDVHRCGETPLQFIAKLQDLGNVIDCRVEMAMVGTLSDEEIVNRIPLFVLIASTVAPEVACDTFGLDKSHCLRLSEDLKLTPAQEELEYDILTPPEQWIEQTSIETPESVSSGGTEESVPEPRPAPLAEESEPARPSPGAGAEDTSPRKRVKPAVKTNSPPAETNLRVHVKLLDNLMNLAGELVLSRNELVQAANSGEQNQITSATQRINMVTSELQEAIMLTRMQPIGNIFSKFPRVVRDLASSLGKQIELSVTGKDVELDKTIIEGLADPLTHLVRNSADHGIEEPAVRRRMNKSEMGQIWLKAYHEAGQVNIEISDDGKGIDPEKLAVSAIQKGLITQDQAKEMSEKEKTDLILWPGFSMAEKVTDISGRGVGMDVVKTNLDKLGGQIEIDSRVGHGTTIVIKLPLTLAIIPSLMISSNGQRYAIPMVNVVELLRIPGNQIDTRIEKVGDASVVRLRSELLPTIGLREVLTAEFDAAGPEKETDSAEQVATREAMNIVVVSAGSFKYGLIVDDLHDSEEIVVKPLDRHLKKSKGYAGATIMGNGQVALILDVASLARMADLNVDEIGAKAASEDSIVEADQNKDVHSLLIFGSAESDKYGVPVDLVGRIEKISASDIDRTGGKKTMKYRGGILPVYSIDEVANVEPLAERDELLVIVFDICGHEFGLLAISPIDTVDVTVDLDDATLKQRGIEGSAIINGQTTLIVDIFEMITTIHPEWIPEGQVACDGKQSKTSPTILYAEDSGFFRNTVKSLLEEQGYRVLDAEDGMRAWDLMQDNADDVSIVLTDVEMPNLGGIGLTKKIRADSRFKNIPIIALTTLAGDKDIETGLEAGVTEYMIKLDKERLLRSVLTFMHQTPSATPPSPDIERQTR